MRNALVCRSPRWKVSRSLRILLVGLPVLAGLCSLPLARAQAPARNPALESEFPEGDGKQLVINACQKCHTLDRIYQSDLWTYQWRETVQKMVDRGADLHGYDVNTAVLYLAKNFRPSGPVRARVVLPDGPGKAIIQGDCQKCHSLQKIVTMRRSATDWNILVHVMIRQGAKVSEDDIGPIVDYLVKNFGPTTNATPATTP